MSSSANNAVKPQTSSWTSVCAEDELFLDTGSCVLFDGEQVAIFKLGWWHSLYAVSNYDPAGEANVLSRGIVGTSDGKLVVASPLYKHKYCLETGECLAEPYRIRTYQIRSHNGQIQLKHRH